MNTNLKKLDPLNTIISRLGLKDAILNDDQRKVINELAEANEKLLEAEQLKSNFLSNIRNEINNPITSILELSRRISEGKLEEKTIWRYADLIYSEAFNLDFQMRNIVAAADIESGEITISPARMNVYTLIFSTLQSFEHQIAKKNLKLSVNNSANGSFSTDPEKIRLILRNLVANSIEFNEEGASIELVGKVESGHLIISVSDNGEGIDERERERIFDRFIQLDCGSNKLHKGQGLGLSLVKSLVELLNGKLEIESKEGKGASFSVSVPEFSEENALSIEGNDFLFDTESEIIF